MVRENKTITIFENSGAEKTLTGSEVDSEIVDIRDSRNVTIKTSHTQGAGETNNVVVYKIYVAIKDVAAKAELVAADWALDTVLTISPGGTVAVDRAIYKTQNYAGTGANQKSANAISLSANFMKLGVYEETSAGGTPTTFGTAKIDVMLSDYKNL
jgi:hypothetical protein